MQALGFLFKKICVVSHTNLGEINADGGGKVHYSTLLRTLGISFFFSLDGGGQKTGFSANLLIQNARTLKL